MENTELLHEIDKRLAVIEALNKQHGKQTDEQFEHLERQIELLNVELSKLKFKLAGIASGVSALVAVGSKWLLHF